MADKHSVETIKKLLEAAKPREFKETVEVSVNLRDVDLSVPKNRVDEEVVLPKGRGKPIRVCVFASGELALKARAVADLVIQPQEIEEYASDKRTFHAAIGTRDMPPEGLADNLDALIRRVVGKLERGRFNIQSAYVKTTMGPSVRYL